MEKQKFNLQLFAAIPGLAATGTMLSYKSEETYTEVAGVKAIPEFGGDPERIDVTTLKDTKRKYVRGIEDVENLEFAIVYQTENFTELDALVAAGNLVEFKVTYPDGMEVTFTGEPSYKFGATEINGALEFTLVIIVSEGPEFVPVA